MSDASLYDTVQHTKQGMFKGMNHGYVAERVIPV